MKIVGIFADITDERKKILLRITVLGGILASSMVFAHDRHVDISTRFVFLTQVIVNIALGLNSSLLPHTAHPLGMNRVSSLGYAMGYIGGGLLLTVNTAVFFFAQRLGNSNDLAVRRLFLDTPTYLGARVEYFKKICCNTMYTSYF